MAQGSDLTPRKITYPTFGKGQPPTQKCRLVGGCVSSRENMTYVHDDLHVNLVRKKCPLPTTFKVDAGNDPKHNQVPTKL